MPKKPGNISFVMSMPACVWAIRGSVYSVAVSGGGHGAPASQVRNDRLAVSLASRKLRAVEPVRGSPSPNSGATISCSAISGCRACHCSTSSRLTRRPTIWSIITLSPNSLSADSVVSEPTRTSRPSSPRLFTEVVRARPRDRGLDQLLDVYPHGHQSPARAAPGRPPHPKGSHPSIPDRMEWSPARRKSQGHHRVTSSRAAAPPRLRQVEILPSRTARAAVFPRARWRTGLSCPPRSAGAGPGPSARDAALGRR